MQSGASALAQEPHQQLPQASSSLHAQQTTSVAANSISTPTTINESTTHDEQQSTDNQKPQEQQQEQQEQQQKDKADGATADTPNNDSNSDSNSNKKDAKAVPVRKRLSLACTTCRQRKVKCDGGRPSCKTCAKFNWPCIYQPSNRKRGPRPRALAMMDSAIPYANRSPWSVAHGYYHQYGPPGHSPVGMFPHPPPPPPFAIQSPDGTFHHGPVQVDPMSRRPGGYDYDTYSTYGDFVASSGGAIRVRPANMNCAISPASLSAPMHHQQMPGQQPHPPHLPIPNHAAGAVPMSSPSPSTATHHPPLALHSSQPLLHQQHVPMLTSPPLSPNTAPPPQSQQPPYSNAYHSGALDPQTAAHYYQNQRPQPPLQHALYPIHATNGILHASAPPVDSFGQYAADPRHQVNHPTDMHGTLPASAMAPPPSSAQQPLAPPPRCADGDISLSSPVQPTRYSHSTAEAPLSVPIPAAPSFSSHGQPSLHVYHHHHHHHQANGHSRSLQEHDSYMNCDINSTKLPAQRSAPVTSTGNALNVSGLYPAPPTSLPAPSRQLPFMDGESRPRLPPLFEALGADCRSVLPAGSVGHSISGAGTTPTAGSFEHQHQQTTHMPPPRKDSFRDEVSKMLAYDNKIRAEQRPQRSSSTHYEQQGNNANNAVEDHGSNDGNWHHVRLPPISSLGELK